MSLHMLGANPFTGVYGGILSAAGDLVQAGIDTYDAQQAGAKASAEEKAKLAAVITADAAVADAKTQCLLAEGATDVDKPSGKARLSACQAVLDSALRTQDAAAAALPASARAARSDTAQKALAAAAAKFRDAPSNANASAAYRGWQWTVNRVFNDEIVKVPGPTRGSDRPAEEGFLSRHIVGPVRVWHAGLAGIAGGALWWAARRGLLW